MQHEQILFTDRCYVEAAKNGGAILRYFEDVEYTCVDGKMICRVIKGPGSIKFPSKIKALEYLILNQ